MARYSDSQRNKNRRTVVFGVVGLHVLLVAVSFWNSSGVEALLGGSILIFVLAMPVWFLFGGKKAGTIDGSWVDGWKSSRDSWQALGIFQPGTASKKSEDEDSDRTV